MHFYQIASGTSSDFALNITKSEDGTFVVETDVTFSNNLAPLGSEEFFSLWCVNTEQSNYQVTGEPTNLTAWAIEYQCASDCSSLDSVFSGTAGYKWFVTSSASYTTTNQFSFPAMSELTLPPFISFSNTTKSSVYTPIYEVAEGQLSSYGLPNLTETFYYSCFSLANSSSSLAAAGVTGVHTVMTTSGGNATVTSVAQNGSANGSGSGVTGASEREFEYGMVLGVGVLGVIIW